MGLEVKNLHKKYGDKVVVDNLSVEMKGPGVYALLGTNGAGKTTTVKMLNGLTKPCEGDVLINGESTKNFTTAQMARKVGYVF